MASTRLTYVSSEAVASLGVEIYNTRSNKVRVIKTPGGKLRYLHIKKKGSPPKCGDCGIKLPGVSHDLVQPVLGEDAYWASVANRER
ncbi:MAG: 60S ribosomal protein L34 [Pleopsidium flavum]|nr:MAG: 60S ribosomal protein L34 [Pleopsidium flavum]